jgi:spore coat protein U-like protein
MKRVHARVRLFLETVAIVLAVTAVPSLGAQVCTISNATPLTFDPIYDGRRAYDGRASFTITCASTQTTMISLVYSHRMRSGTRGADITYDLYATPDHSTIWGSGGDGAIVTQTFPAGRPTTVFVYARIPPHQQPPAAGHFNDSVAIVTLP